MRAVMRSALVGPAVLVTAALAACGDDRGAFVREADRACAERVRLVERAAAAAASSGEGVPVEVYERELGALRAIEPPAADAGRYRRLLDLYAERTDRWRDATRVFNEAASNADSARDIRDGGDRFARSLERFQAVQTRGNQLARELGLRLCGRQGT
jgi:hypothetical protein